MKISDLQLSAYDLIGIILPGAITLAEIGVSIYGVTDFWARATHVTTSGAVLLAMAAFALGQLVNQASQQAITTVAATVKTVGKPFGKFRHLNPDRVLRQARDAYWGVAETRKLVCDTLNKACKANVIVEKNDPYTCDKAYNLSLELLGNTFEKRAIFTLMADLALSFWLLSLTAIIPLTIVLRGALSPANTPAQQQMHITHYLLGLLASAIAAGLSWQRTLDFQLFADDTVFDILLAVAAIHPGDFKSPHSADSDD